mgnify:CR=1 FL=1
MKKENLLIVIGLAILLLIGGLFIGKGSVNLRGIETNPNAYSSAPSYSTSTLTNNLATIIVPRATSSRVYAQVCNYTSADILWVYKQATSTGVVIGRGSPAFSSSSANYPQFQPCFRVDSDDAYTGQIWGIINSTTTVTVEYLQS